MKMSFARKATCAAVGMAFAATAAWAAVTFDINTGTGFVGKGDVQDVFDWNNSTLQQQAASVQFRASLVSEISWICTNTNNQNTQERERTTTTAGVVSTIARERNQITGFLLQGYSGTPTSSTDGPPVNSCPSGPWSLTTPAGAPVVVSGGLQVSINSTDWFPIPKPLPLP